jgi:hypothetical protein
MLVNTRRDRRRLRHLRLWAAPTAAVLTGVGALCASAVAQASPAPSSGTGTIVVSGDSVVATSLPSFGPATISVTRQDALTGAPVVIGVVTGTANPFTPFSANTTTPTPLNPSGDCWQPGALSEALTPDIQPGDVVTVAQNGSFGGGSSSTSTVVQPSDEANGVNGPIAGCSSIAPWARNAITTAPSTVAPGADLTVSGVAQPLATSVSVSASDGSTTTESLSTTPAADGTWSLTIPASELVGLASGNMTVTPVMAVPDVTTGAPAHIAGVGVTVNKTTSASAGTGGSTSAEPGESTSPNRTITSVKSTGGTDHTDQPRAHVTRVRAASRVSLAGVRKHGIKVSFVDPSSIRMVQVVLRSGRRVVYVARVASHRAGSRQTVTLPAKIARRLPAGKYTLAIRVGSSSAALDAPTTRDIRITE